MIPSLLSAPAAVAWVKSSATRPVHPVGWLAPRPAPTTTDPLGTMTTYAYDATGNLVSKSTPLAGGGTATWSYTYGSKATAGEMLSSTNPDGKATTYGYDSAGEQTSITDLLGKRTSGSYDRDGRLLTRTTPNGNTTTNVFDAAGELTKTTDPLGKTTSYSYDGDGNQISMTDANGHKTTYTYNADNEQTQITRADGSTATTTYDGDGNVLTQADGNGHTTTYTYDPLNRIASMTDPDAHRTTYSYDPAGNETSSVDSTGGTTTYTYDVDNRVTAISYSDATTPHVTESYDADGHRTSMTDGTGTSSFRYDTLGRLTSQTNGAGATISYSYDPAANVTSIAYPNGQRVSRAFDDDGRLKSVTDWLGNATTFAYDADSNLVTEALPSATGVVDQSRSDNADRLAKITDTRGTTSLFSASYERNAIGQLTFDNSVHGPDHSYGYTALNQLCYAAPNAQQPCTQPQPPSVKFSYDLASNLVQDGGTTQAFDPADELCWTVSPNTGNASCSTSPAGATTYRYDTRGNRTRATPATGTSTTLSYDQANRLVAYTGPTSMATYSYDGDGLRMSKVVGGTATNRFAWDESGSLPLLLQEANAYYINGPDGEPIEQISGSTPTYLLSDQQHSTRVLINDGGAVVATYTYDPWGNVASHTGTAVTNLQYDGEYTDTETGFQYRRARYYDPSTGQFLTRDPAAPLTSTEAQAAPPYEYGNDDPLNMIDPSGLGSCPNGVAIPFTDLCLDNPLDLSQDAQNFDQNSHALDNTPIIGTIIGWDPFYGDLRDTLYAAQGCQVNWAADLVNTGAAFLPGPGKIAEWVHLPGGVDGAFAGTVAQMTGNYRLGAVLQNNAAFVDLVNGGVVQGSIQSFLPSTESCACLGGG